MNPSEPPPLEPLIDAVLDEATLDQLLFDISACAKLLEIRTKGAPTEYARDLADLGRAVADLRAGRILGLQLTYIHQGSEWRDTLLGGAQGIRLVRIGARPRD
jgi:hypothetical protein